MNDIECYPNCFLFFILSHLSDTLFLLIHSLQIVQNLSIIGFKAFNSTIFDGNIKWMSLWLYERV
jgi:hypothetical protein